LRFLGSRCYAPFAQGGAMASTPAVGFEVLDVRTQRPGSSWSPLGPDLRTRSQMLVAVAAAAGGCPAFCPALRPHLPPQRRPVHDRCVFGVLGSRPPAAVPLGKAFRGAVGLEAGRLNSCLVGTAVAAGFAAGTMAVASRQPRAGANSRQVTTRDGWDGSSPVQTPALATMAGVLMTLRLAESKARTDMLKHETEEGLKAICVGLRVKGSGSAAKLRTVIQKTLEEDEALCDPTNDMSRIISVIGQVPDSRKASKWLEEKHTGAQLKTLCIELRLKQAGKKNEVAERVTQEARDLWKVMAARAGVSGKTVPPSTRDSPQEEAAEAPPQVQAGGSSSSGSSSNSRTAKEEKRGAQHSSAQQPADTESDVASAQPADSRGSRSQARTAGLDDSQQPESASETRRALRDTEARAQKESSQEAPAPAPAPAPEVPVPEAPDTSVSASTSRSRRSRPADVEALFSQVEVELGNPEVASSGAQAVDEHPATENSSASSAHKYVPEQTYQSSSASAPAAQANSYEPPAFDSSFSSAQADGRSFDEASFASQPAESEQAAAFQESTPSYAPPDNGHTEFRGAQDGDSASEGAWDSVQVEQVTSPARDGWSDDVAGVTVVQTEALGSKEQEQMEKRQKRFMERRMKLVGYLAEEVAGVYGGVKDRYIADMHNILQGVSDETREAYLGDKLEGQTTEIVTQRLPRVLGPGNSEVPEFGAWHSEPVQDEMILVGELGPSRQAWCSWWDRDSGCGELVDLDDQNPVAVVSASLTTGANVSPRLKYLRNGEFVEYRRVDRAVGQSARAVLVRGLRGWPLMCEVDGGRALQA